LPDCLQFGSSESGVTFTVQRWSPNRHRLRGHHNPVSPAACWLGVDRSALVNDRALVSSVTPVVLASWALAAAPKLIPGRSNAVPLLGTGMLITLVLFFRGRAVSQDGHRDRPRQPDREHNEAHKAADLYADQPGVGYGVS
jgi:hypothetical protein